MRTLCKTFCKFLNILLYSPPVCRGGGRGQGGGQNFPLLVSFTPGSHTPSLIIPPSLCHFYYKMLQHATKFFSVSSSYRHLGNPASRTPLAPYSPELSPCPASPLSCATPLLVNISWWSAQESFPGESQ